jgi:hypothetical protein
MSADTAQPAPTVHVSVEESSGAGTEFACSCGDRTGTRDTWLEAFNAMVDHAQSVA